MRLEQALQSSVGRFRPFAGAETVNCFAQFEEGDAKERLSLAAAPGLKAWAEIGTGPYRGSIKAHGVLYFVSGSALYRVRTDKTFDAVGAIPGVGPAQMASNGIQVAIAANGLGFIATATTFGQITDPDLISPVTSVAYVDGYFLWSAAGSFQVSRLLDGENYDALDVASAEGAPDDIVGIVVDHRDVYLIGEETIEVWYNSGNLDFPFERQGNAFIERGAISRDTLVKIDNSIFWLDEAGVVFRIAGMASPVRISTHAIEFWLRGATDFVAWTYRQEGHEFYVLSCSAGTRIFDVATGVWHARESYKLPQWRAQGFVRFAGFELVGCFRTGKLYELSLDEFLDDENPMIWRIQLPPIHFGRTLRTLMAFEADIETGVGRSFGQGQDPQIMLRYSRDYGATWSRQLWRSLGRTGDRLRRAIWRNLGQFRQMTIELVISDPVQRASIAYDADIE